MAPIRVSCYGKLPNHGGFIRHETGGREFDELDRWLREGVNQARDAFGTSWSSTFKNAPPSNFIFCPEGSSQFLLGVWVPSSDRNGRKFPFAIFLTLERALFEPDVSLLPGVFGEFLGAAHTLAAKGRAYTDLKRLGAGVAELDPSVDLDAFRSRYDDFVRHEKASVFWRGLFGSADDAGKNLVIQKLHAVSGRMVGAEMSGTAQGLRCPLPSALGREDTGYEVTFCMDLGLQLFGRRGIPSLTTWDRGGNGDASRMCIFFGRPSPDWMLPVLRPQSPSDHIIDLASGDFGQAEMLREEYAATVGRPDLTLAGLLLEVAVLRSS